MAIKKSKSLKKKMAVKKPVAKAGSKTRTPVVCLGASAGGLEAFIQVLGNMPVNTGLAFILVQHLDPKHSSMSAPIISRSTSLPVEEIKDGTVVLPNRVYAIPPNHNLEIANGILKLSPREESGSNMSIDHFMKSLAASEKNRAIGVVLSGTGTDGSAGLWAIKAEGGVTIAQRPNSAKYTGMPESAISAGVVDLVLTPQEITQELVKLSVNPYLTAEEIEDPQERLHTAPAASKEKFPDIQTAFAADGGMHRILSLLFNLTKVDFSGYKHTTIKRRIQRRMVVHKIKSLKAYADFLADHEEEIYALYDDVLINVTEFFRDPEAFAALNKKAFPAIVKNRPPGAPIRVWVPGCSTGEEVYSIAILLLEFLAEHGKHCQIQIFATDISNAAIQMARNGLYPDSISKNVSKERLSLFFEKVESGYKIHKRIRDLCLFSRHDVTCDPPFAKLDLISCRNVLIYFGAGLQKKVLPVFHYGLRAEGFLWLGKSESPGEFSKLFKLVDKTYRLYCKSDLPFPLNFSFRNKISRESHEVIKNPQSFVTAGFDFQKEADKLMLTRFAPPGVIISGDFEVLQFRGRTIPFLEPATGRPTSNLLKMLRPELLGALRASVQKVKKHKRPVLVKDLQFEVEGRILKTELEVLPFNSAANGKGNHFLVLFRAVAKKAVPKASAKGKKVPSGKSVQIGKLNEMQRELSEIKEYQESLIEQYESAQEELTSANEELQSTNEEFQSTNEELETSQEELQSTNEELITVNDELQIRNSDLSQLSSDLNNLLASIEIPVLIVGSNNRIRMFSPKARSMFNLIQADIGRPISDLKSNLNLDVSAVVAEVSSTLTLIEIEVQDINGSWMRVQVRPYRTVDNRIEGVVISVMDIDLLKQKQIKARELIEYHTSIAEAVPLPLAVVNRRLEFESGNNSFYKYFHANQSAIGKDLFNVLKIHESCLQPLKKALNSALNENQIFTDIEIDCEVPGFGSRKILCSAGKIHWSGPQPDAALISFIDVTEQRLFDEERKYLLQQEQEARLQADSANRSKDIFLATVTHELRTPLASILSWSQLISGGHVNYEKAREGAAVIERSAKIQNQLIDDLLDISRVIWAGIA